MNMQYLMPEIFQFIRKKVNPMVLMVPTPTRRLPSLRLPTRRLATLWQAMARSKDYITANTKLVSLFLFLYPQKGQPYGPYGAYAYPGPYHYGSQYGLSYSQY